MYSLLLVDDEPLALAGLQNIIDWESYGFRICGACMWPEDAVALAAETHPDVLITDLRMPETDGMKLYQNICENGQKPELVIVSAYSDFQVARTAIEYGAAAYILKPIEKEEVIRTVQRLAERLTARNRAARAEESLPADDPEQLDDQLRDMNLPPFRRLLCLEAGERPPENADGKWIPLQHGELSGLWLLALSTSAVPEELIRRGYMFAPEGILSSNNSVLFPSGGLLATDKSGGRKHGILTPASENGTMKTLLAQAQTAAWGGFRYSSNPMVAEIQFYIGTHYAEPLSLEDISGRFYLSGTYLSNLFKKFTGVNLIAFLNHVRIHQACRLIERGNLRLKEVAAATGYHDYGHFNRQFRRVMGCSPEHLLHRRQELLF